MIDREQLAALIFSTQAAFQRRRGIRDGYIDEWRLLSADDLAREEYLAVADAVLALMGPEIEQARRGMLPEDVRLDQMWQELILERDRLHEQVRVLTVAATPFARCAKVVEGLSPHAHSKDWPLCPYDKIAAAIRARTEPKA